MTLILVIICSILVYYNFFSSQEGPTLEKDIKENIQTGECRQVGDECCTDDFCTNADAFYCPEDTVRKVLGCDKTKCTPIVDCFSEHVTPEHTTTITETPITTTTIEEDSTSQIRECSGQLFTVSPIEVDKINSIYPLGAINPPGHTLPTEHIYLHMTYGGQTTSTTPLRAPGDIYITSISSSSDDIAGDRTEYSIHFALCKDVYGYYNHVKELSDEILSLFENAECVSWSVSEDGYCTKEVFHSVNAGTVIGGVGHLQGNFDLGVHDHRIKNEFANVERYSSRTPHIVCPLEYYDEVTKEQLYNKIERTVEPRCGEVMQDVPGTLQGNWFHEDTVIDVDWETNLGFVHDAIDTSKAIISVGGKFMEASEWEFTEETSGLVNRKFSDVTPGNVYCYDEDYTGRIIVQLMNETELKIEYQDGDCTGEFQFNNPTKYYR